GPDELGTQDPSILLSWLASRCLGVELVLPRDSRTLRGHEHPRLSQTLAISDRCWPIASARWSQRPPPHSVCLGRVTRPRELHRPHLHCWRPLGCESLRRPGARGAPHRWRDLAPRRFSPARLGFEQRHPWLQFFPLQPKLPLRQLGRPSSRPVWP